jgi:hypothetical protein
MGIFLASSRILEKYNMPCHAMHPMQDYFWKDFYMHDESICNLYALLCWQNFILAKKWVLQTYPLRGISPSRFRNHLEIF